MITVIGDIIVDIVVNKEETNYATDTDGNIHFRSGGQANNVASFIGREGVDCQLIGRVGKDPFGIFLIEESKQHGVTPNVKMMPNEKTGSIVLLIENETGERSMITDRGANVFLSEEDLVGVEESDIIYLSGYCFFSEATRSVATVVKERAHALHIPLAVDPSSTYHLHEQREAFLSFLEGTTFFFPNYDEGVLLTGRTEPKQIVEDLRKYVKYPILTLGEKGCLFYHDERYFEVVPPPVKVVDTTAAGDSFVGAFLATYVQTKDIILSVDHAVKTSANTVSYVGALPE